MSDGHTCDMWGRQAAGDGLGGGRWAGGGGLGAAAGDGWAGGGGRWAMGWGRRQAMDGLVAAGGGRWAGGGGRWAMGWWRRAVGDGRGQSERGQAEQMVLSCRCSTAGVPQTVTGPLTQTPGGAPPQYSASTHPVQRRCGWRAPEPRARRRRRQPLAATATCRCWRQALQRAPEGCEGDGLAGGRGSGRGRASSAPPIATLRCCKAAQRAWVTMRGDKCSRDCTGATGDGDALRCTY